MSNDFFYCEGFSFVWAFHGISISPVAFMTVILVLQSTCCHVCVDYVVFWPLKSSFSIVPLPQKLLCISQQGGTLSEPLWRLFCSLSGEGPCCVPPLSESRHQPTRPKCLTRFAAHSRALLAQDSFWVKLPLRILLSRKVSFGNCRYILRLASVLRLASRNGGIKSSNKYEASGVTATTPWNERKCCWPVSKKLHLKRLQCERVCQVLASHFGMRDNNNNITTSHFYGTL